MATSSRTVSWYIFGFFLFLSPLVSLCGSSSSPPEDQDHHHDHGQLPNFHFRRFINPSHFESQIALSGDAKAISSGNGAFLHITGPWNSSAGRVMYRKPITLAERQNPRRKFSFATRFSFSISSEPGDGLAFVMLPDDVSDNDDDNGVRGVGSFGLAERTLGGALAVELDTRLDPQYGDLNANHVGIDVDGLVSVKVSNASKAQRLVLNSGEKLQCWIDYEASSQRLEVRLNRYGLQRPLDPLLSCPIDLSQLFKNNRVYFGLTSSNGNSTQVTKLYSWSFKLRPVPYWMHSQPLDLESFDKDAKHRPVVVARTVHKRTDCVLRVATALIAGTGCGALGAFIVLLLWTLFTDRTRPIVPEEFVEYDCDKVKVLVVDKPPAQVVHQGNKLVE